MVVNSKAAASGVLAAVLISFAILRAALDLTWLQLVFSAILPLSLTTIVLFERGSHFTVDAIILKFRGWVIAILSLIDKHIIDNSDDDENDTYEKLDASHSRDASGRNSASFGKIKEFSFGDGGFGLFLRDSKSNKYLVVDGHKLRLVDDIKDEDRFVVIPSKENRWGFQSHRTGRFVGQNVMHKVVVTAKKLRSWEEFQVFSCTSDREPTTTLADKMNHSDRMTHGDNKSSSADKSSNGCFSSNSSKTNNSNSTSISDLNKGVRIYLMLGRYGKGLWLGYHRNKIIFSKHFRRALRFRFCENKKTFELEDKQYTSREETLTRCPSTVVNLPWITSQSDSFFENPSDAFTSILNEKIEFSAEQFFENFINDSFATECHERSGNSQMDFTPWLSHPLFGHIRQQTFRTPVSGIPGLTSSMIDEYQSYVFNPNKSELVFRTKTYTLDVPYGSYFSVESLILVSNCSNLQHSIFNCSTAVYFSKNTMFRKQIERGAKEGTRKGYEGTLQLLRTKMSSNMVDRRQRGFSAAIMVDGMFHHIHDSFTKNGDSLNGEDTIVLPWVSKNSESFLQAKKAQFKSILQDVLPITPEQYFDHYLSDNCSFFAVRHADSGSLDMDVSQWVRHPLYGRVRKQAYRAPQQKSPSNFLHIEEYHQYWFSKNKDILTFSSKTYSRDIPYGKDFTVELILTVHRVGNEKLSKLEFFTAVHFSKKLVFNGKIKKLALKGARQSAERFLEQKKIHLKKLATNAGSPVDTQFSQESTAPIILNAMMDIGNETD